MRLVHYDAIEDADFGAGSPFPGIAWATALLVRHLLAPLTVALALTVPFYLATLTVFLFRPPVLEFHCIDRIAFGALASLVVLRALVLRQTISRESIALPMAALAALTVTSLASHSFLASDWSAVASKYIVPFSMFFLAGLVFRGASALRWLERFLLIVLVYLSFTAIAFLLDAHELIFPRFILDEGIGIHADRARGPFLQAVANGLTINLLGLLAIGLYRRRSLRGVGAFLLLATMPLAILATKTRAVWLSFAASLAWIVWHWSDRRLRRGILAWAMVGIVVAAMIVGLGGGGRALGDRLQENSPVEFRLAAYRAGWEMFLERPWLGWGTGQIQSELARRISGFQGDAFAVHNTYVDVLLEQGLAGFGFYLWIVVALFRLASRRVRERADFVTTLAGLWPLLLAVYLLNATFVVMNYQFVNGLVFTLAGILAAHSTSQPARVHVSPRTS